MYQPQIKRLLNNLLTFTAIFLAIPFFLILVSWNALPGEHTYPIKTSLEKITIVFLGNTSAARSLKIKYTERRFFEATKLLETKADSKGYLLLLYEVGESKDQIVSAQDDYNAQKLLTNIDKYQLKISEKQAELIQLEQDLQATEKSLEKIEAELQSSISS